MPSKTCFDQGDGNVCNFGFNLGDKLTTNPKKITCKICQDFYVENYHKDSILKKIEEIQQSLNHLKLVVVDEICRKVYKKSI